MAGPARGAALGLGGALARLAPEAGYDVARDEVRQAKDHAEERAVEE